MLTRLLKLEKLRIVRYAVAAGTATLVDVLAYGLLERPLGETLAFCASYSAGILVNFLISKYYVFSESELSTSTQFTRFWIVALIVFGANYLLMWGIDAISENSIHYGMDYYPYVKRFVSAGIIAVISFLSHKFFSFAVK